MARPEHKPTAATRRRVAISAGGGMPHEDIALALGITAPTLKKHYRDELSVGAATKRMDVLGALYVAATKKKNTSAAKAYLEHTPQPAGQGAKDEATPPAPKGRPSGKKAIAQQDATTAQAGTGWEGILPDNVTPLRIPA